MSTGNINKLLDKLEVMIIKGIPVPFTAYAFVDNEKIIDTLDKIRASIPSEMQEAISIIKRRDEIGVEAQKKAQQVISDAQRQADQVLCESELLRAVQGEAERIRQQVIADCEQLKNQTKEEAEQIKAQAFAEAASLREGSEKYAEAILASLHQDLTEMHSIVQNGQRHISKLKTEGLPPPPSSNLKSKMGAGSGQNIKKPK